MPIDVTIPRVSAILVPENFQFESAHSPMRLFCDDMNSYIVKSDRSTAHYTDHGFFNEFICSYFLKGWKCPVPSISCVFVDSIVFDNIDIGKQYDLRSYDGPCFGSKEIVNYDDFIYTEFSQGLKFANRFENPSDFVKIGLFDLWVHNTDRNANHSNLIFDQSKKKLKIYGIDHVYAFNKGVSYNRLTDIGVLPDSESILTTGLVKKIYKKNYQKWEPIDWKSYFYESINECHEKFNDIIGLLEYELVKEIPYALELERFLFDTTRNKQVITDFYRKLK